MKSDITVKILGSTPDRIYPTEVLELALKNAQVLIDENKLFVTKRNRESTFVSLLDIIGTITKLELNDGSVYAAINFLDTPAYRVVKETIDNIPNFDINSAFSCFGFGTVKKNENKVDVVQSDFELCCAYLK